MNINKCNNIVKIIFKIWKNALTILVGQIWRSEFSQFTIIHKDKNAAHAFLDDNAIKSHGHRIFRRHPKGVIRREEK